MRFVRLMQAAFLAILLLLDLVIGSVVTVISPSSLIFISSLHFLGLVLLAQNDTLFELLVKVFCVSLWLDLNHIGSYPVFMFSYMTTFLVIFYLRKYVGSTGLEMTLMVILSLFLKEVLMFFSLSLFKAYSGSLVGFIAYRSFWVIIGNLVFIPLVIWLHKQMHRAILQRAQNLYMR